MSYRINIDLVSGVKMLQQDTHMQNAVNILYFINGLEDCGPSMDPCGTPH